MAAPTDERWLHWVTLYTDGSWTREHGGAYAFRARASLPPCMLEEAGSVHPEANADSLMAELWAIVKGVSAVTKAWDRVDGIGVRTDCQALVAILRRGARSHRRQDIRRIQQAAWELIRRKEEAQGSPCYLKVIWVKGHQVKAGKAAESAQAWMNDRVDKLAYHARKNK